MTNDPPSKNSSTDLMQAGVAQSARRQATEIFSRLLGFAAAVSLLLLGWLPLSHRNGGWGDYTAVGELLLVFVIALEGRVAIWEFTHSQRSVRQAANAAVFAMHEKYLSPDYQANVRRTAWFCLWKARRNSGYRLKVLAGLAGGLPDDQFEEAYERHRANSTEAPDDEEIWHLHVEYHRVQDILAFFNSLALLPADAEIVQVCDFFYDRWRYPLYRIVRDLQEYELASQDSVAEKSRQKRCEDYQSTLRTLDAQFKLSELTKGDWDTNPLLRNQP